MANLRMSVLAFAVLIYVAPHTAIASSPARRLPPVESHGRFVDHAAPTAQVDPSRVTDESAPTNVRLSSVDIPALPQLVSNEIPLETDCLPEDAERVDLQLFAFWRNGLVLESRDEAFRVHIGGRIQQDWAFLGAESEVQSAVGPFDDQVFFRRLRFQPDGRIFGNIDWMIDIELANQIINVVQDVWINVGEVPWLGNIRIGHIRFAVGLENNYSSKYLTFLERSAIQDAFLEEYDPGIKIWNMGLNENVSWTLGFYDFDPDEDGRSFGGGKYAGAGRVTWVPWARDNDRNLLHTGASASIRGAGLEPAAGFDAIRFRARPEVRQAPVIIDTGLVESSSTSIFGLETAFIRGPLSIQGEFLLATINNAVVPTGGTSAGDLTFHGYYVFVSYFLTGEHRPYNRRNGTFGRIIPLNNFPRRGGPGAGCATGAWELTARFSDVDVNSGPVLGGRLQAVTSGINWYWNPNLRIQANYIFTHRDDVPAGSGGIHSAAVRFALNF